MKLFAKKQEAERENNEIIDVAEEEMSEEAMTKQTEDIEYEAQMPDDAQRVELDDAAMRAKEELRMQKYRAKLVIKRAKCRKKIAELKQTVYALEKEAEEISREIDALDNGEA